MAQSPTVVPVILCGGAGTRLWPASRPSRPKQFLPLLGARSLFQDTVLRMGRLKGAAEAVVVTGQAHLDAIRRQLEEIGAEAFVIVEPEGRDSAPAMAAAASWIAEHHPGAIAVCVASDHHIPDVDAFCAAAEIAVTAALEGAIATFGVRPSHASTAYGYLEPGEPLEIKGASRLRRFVEKPNGETAQLYLDAGYLWNSGNFVFAAERLLEELERFAPAVAEKARAAHASGRTQDGVLSLGLDFLASPKISIDYAVMEKTRHAALGWRGPWRQAIDHALACLEARYRRPDGLYRTLAAPDGQPLEEAALLYDQAFVLIALAAAARAMPERRRTLEAKAGGLLDLILAGFRHEAGGFVEREHERSPPRYGLAEEGAYQCNAQMHLFEAALGWRQVGEDARWAVVADEIGDLCCSRFVDAKTGALTELFEADWRPAAGDAGRILDPGHHFEWAWLLEQWSWVSGRPEGARVAERLFAAGERGVDRGRGVVMDSLDADFAARDRTARLWPQTERLKAAHLLARRAGPGAMQTYLEAAREAAQTLASYLEVPLPGLWRDQMGPDGRFAEGPAPGSSLYHIVAAIAEVSGIRITPAPDPRKAACAS